jgi:hypothetical protein
MSTALHPIGLDLDFLPEKRLVLTYVERALTGRVVSATPRGCSSAGRAPDLHSGGRRFDPDQLHQFPAPDTRKRQGEQFVPGRRACSSVG